MSAKYSIADIKAQFLNRNLILIILIRILDTLGNTMIGGTQGKIANSIGVAAFTIGMIATVNSVAKLLTRVPSGGIVDHNSKKKVLLFAFLLKIVDTFLYMFSSNTVIYCAARVLQGISGAFLGVAIPAVFAVTLKKNSMGLAYAVYTAVYTLCQNVGRPIGLSIYNATNQFTLCAVIIVLTVAALILSQVMDFKTIEEEIEASNAEKGEPKAKSGSFLSNIFSGLLVKAIPMAIVIAVPMLAYTADLLFFPQFTEELGIDSTNMLYIASIIATVMTLITPVLCDFMGPIWGTIVFYGCRVAALFIIGLSKNVGLMTCGVLLNSFGEAYDTPLMLMAYSTFKKSEMGAFNATLFFAMDVISLFAGPIAGFFAARSYSLMYMVMGAITACGIAIFFVVYSKSSLVKENRQKQ